MSDKKEPINRIELYNDNGSTDRYCQEAEVRQLETEYNKLLEDREILYQRSLKDIGLREQMNKAIEKLRKINIICQDQYCTHEDAISALYDIGDLSQLKEV